MIDLVDGELVDRAPARHVRQRITPRSAPAARPPGAGAPAAELGSATDTVDEALASLAQGAVAHTAPRATGGAAGPASGPGPPVGRWVFSPEASGGRVMVPWPSSALAHELAHTEAVACATGSVTDDPRDEHVGGGDRRVARGRLAHRIAAAARARLARADETTAAPATPATSEAVPALARTGETTAAPATPATSEAVPAVVLVRAVGEEIALDAEREARRVIDAALLRLEQIAACARAALADAVLDAPDATDGQPPTCDPRPIHTSLDQRLYSGKVALQIGPLREIEQLDAYHDAIASIPGVRDARVHAVDRNDVHFRLQVTGPTPLLAHLRDRVPDALHVIEAGEGHARLVVDHTRRASTDLAAQARR